MIKPSGRYWFAVGGVQQAAAAVAAEHGGGKAQPAAEHFRRRGHVPGGDIPADAAGGDLPARVKDRGADRRFDPVLFAQRSEQLRVSRAAAAEGVVIAAGDQPRAQPVPQHGLYERLRRQLAQLVEDRPAQLEAHPRQPFPAVGVGDQPRHLYAGDRLRRGPVEEQYGGPQPFFAGGERLREHRPVAQVQPVEIPQRYGPVHVFAHTSVTRSGISAPVLSSG